MKLYLCVLVAGLALMCSPAAAQEGKPLKTSKEKVSYGFGLNVGRSMIRDGLKMDDLDFEALVEGLRDSLSDSEARITEKEFTEAFQAAIAPKLQQRAKAAAEKAKKDGEAHLAANRKKKGVKETESGLQYRVLKSGTGETPKHTDNVRTKYRGTLIDGTVFDQSQQAIEFPVSGVIKGWTEALQLMKEGDKWELTIPAELAYGERGSPEGGILPNSTLIFEVELIEVITGSSTPPAKKREAGAER